MEPMLNVKEGPVWDPQKKFTIITYRRSRTFPQQRDEIHREDLSFESSEAMWDMLMKVSTYNMHETQVTLEKDEDLYTEKILTQL